MIDYTEITINSSVPELNRDIIEAFKEYYSIYWNNREILKEAWKKSPILTSIAKDFPEKYFFEYIKRQLSGNYGEEYIKKQLVIINKFDVSVEGYLEIFNVFHKELENKIQKTVKDKEKYFRLSESFKRIMFWDLTIISKRRTLLTSLLNDPLTGLMNLKNFLKSLKRKINSVQVAQSVIVIIFDIQRFTKIKEIFGYSGADEILIKTKDLLSVITERYFQSSSYIFARTGFDEFSIAITIKNFDILNTYTSKITSEFNEPIFIQGKEIYINLAKGGALYPKHASTPEELMKHAKVSLSVSKNRRNEFVLYSSEYMETLKDIFGLETSIRNAIKNNEFELYYQPKINFKTDKITGVEALIRWNKPGEGIVHPKEFVPFLEESKLIVEVGKWIFQEACKQSKIWKNKGIDLKIAVNISKLQLKQDDFIDFIKNTIEEFDINPDAIEIELTETSNINTDSLINKLKTLKEMGISISIDDFGTGYSSLSYLEHLPISKIKIDLMFIQNLSNSKNLKITQTIIDLANKLNLKTVSEGIETGEQLKVLKELNCDEGQGYFFSKPVSASDIEKIYEKFS